MQNKTDLFGVSSRDRLRHLAKGYRQALLLLGSALSGYVMASSVLFGGVAPFGAAFLAALPWKYASGAAVGAILGHLLRSGQLGSIKYIAAILFLVAIKWLGARRSARHPGRISPPIAAMGSSLLGLGLATAAVLAVSGPTLYDILLSIAELFLATGAAYFFARTIASLELGFSGVSRTDITCIAISFSVVVMGFAPVMAGGFSVGRILCVLIVLLSARYGGEGAGAVSGVAAGIAMGLTGGDFGYSVSSYAFGGLIGGIFGHVGRLAAASAFVVINALCAIFIGSAGDVYTSIGEIFLASVIFILLPQSWLRRLRLTELRPVREEGAATQETLRRRISDISATLREISTTTHEVSRRLSKRENPTLSGVYTQVADRVCRRCGMRTACWQDNYSDTMNALNDCVGILKRDGSVGREQAPRHFVKTCCKLDILLGELNTQFQQYLSREGVQRKVSQVRSVVTDQFEGMAMMLEELAGELCALRLLDGERTRRIKEYFEQEGIQAGEVTCWQDEFQRTHLETRLPAWQTARLNRVKLTLDLSSMLECDFDGPIFTVRDREAVLSLSEKATYTVEIGSYQIPSGANRLCGDSCEYLREQAGRTHLILSDGMGSGGSAAVDSSMASGLISRLLSIGIGHDAALKMINSALLIKSGDESLATIDVCTIDRYTGQADFYKAGAAPTFLLRGGKAGYVESTSLPAGILRGVAFEKSTLTLREGDVVVMVSDGVTATGGKWVVPELRELEESDMQRLCENLAHAARKQREDGREDDITVMAARLCRGA